MSQRKVARLNSKKISLSLLIEKGQNRPKHVLIIVVFEILTVFVPRIVCNNIVETFIMDPQNILGQTTNLSDAGNHNDDILINGIYKV